MQIKDLQPRMGKVDITLRIIEKSEPRTFDKFGKSGKVCNTKANDETGTISLTLWNDDVDKVELGDTVKIENGWVGEYQGELQLSTGKFGKLEVVSKGQQTLASEPKEESQAELSSSNEKEEAKPEPAPVETKTEESSKEEESAPEEVLDEEPVSDEELVE